MTNIVFFKKDNLILGFSCSGHTGYGESGYDIVCSALSSLTQSCAMGLKDVLKIKIDMKKDDKQGYLKVVLPEDIEKSKLRDSQILLDTLYISISDIAKNYSKYIKLEEREYVY